jgi:hypothetical protein
VLLPCAGVHTTVVVVRALHLVLHVTVIHQVPLMKDPRSGDRLCVNCETVYRAGAPLEPPASRSTASTSQGTSAHQHPPQQQPIANGTHAHDSEDESSDFGDDTVAGPVEGRQEDGPLDPRDDPLVFGPFARGTPAAASSSGAGPSTAAAAAAEGSPRTAALPVQGAQQPLAGGGQQGEAEALLHVLHTTMCWAVERGRLPSGAEHLVVCMHRGIPPVVAQVLPTITQLHEGRLPQA